MISRAMRMPSASSSARYSPSPRYGRVHLGAAEFLVGRDLAGRGAQERRAGEKDLGAAAHQDHVVGQAGQIRAARGRGAVHHGDLRNAGGRHARLVGEAAPAFDEHLRLVQQIGAAGFDEAHERQLVLERDLLDAQVLLHAHGRRGAALDGAVIGGNDAADARHVADAGDAAAALDALGAVIVVHAQAGERRQFEPRRTRIDQQRDTLARQQLAAGAKAIALGVGEVPHLLLERAEVADQRQHLLAIGAKRCGVGIDAALDDRHERFSCSLRARRGRCEPRKPEAGGVAILPYQQCLQQEAWICRKGLICRPANALRSPQKHRL